jgi:NAD(P)-dependent dehydrogenase (short-subunit alcohol dehydrogenase family)
MRKAVVIGATGNIGFTVCDTLIANDYQITQLCGDAREELTFNKLPSKIDLALYLPGKNVISSIEDLELKDWKKIIAINLTGAFLLAKHAAKRLKESNGCFISISSILSQHPYPDRSAYAVSKAGLETLTRCLAVEGILSHCIRLGHLDSYTKSWPKNPQVLKAVKDKTPSHRLPTREDVANYILWLVQGGCKAVSGSTIDFDAGYCINRWPL